MVYSFVFLGERNREKILGELSKKINLPTSSYQVIFLTNKKPQNERLSNQFPHINFKTIVFGETATPDQMFETLIHSESLGNLVLFKESAKTINFDDVNRMIEQAQNGAKIVVSKQLKNDNFFTRAFDAVKNFFTRIFIGLKLYPGEADIILLDSVLCETLAQLDGKSALLTKVNGWAGVSPKVVSTSNQEKEKKPLKFKQFVFPLVWAVLFLGMIVGNILFAVLGVKLPFIGIFSYIIGEIAMFGIFIYSLTKALFNARFGQIAYVLQAEVVEVIDNFDE